ncbi:hypothetical protein LPB67_15450 [Undibacterium sp. Jales W-56]|uniref:hypothetical protein n=1 Tax=Undibacterium sp. Jales W-56 TaxID=2897325 RepID=UPI0021D2EC2C|nr:hypothetical protein [Undibacterium sp. Jales W-56]MCU6435172.1 hypothetical protein [Undibacterium sp. Jales W-56]
MSKERTQAVSVDIIKADKLSISKRKWFVVKCVSCGLFYAGEQRRINFEDEVTQFDVVLTKNKNTAVKTSHADKLIHYLSRAHGEMAWVCVRADEVAA